LHRKIGRAKGRSSGEGDQRAGGVFHQRPPVPPQGGYTETEGGNRRILEEERQIGREDKERRKRALYKGVPAWRGLSNGRGELSIGQKGEDALNEERDSPGSAKGKGDVRSPQSITIALLKVHRPEGGVKEESQSTRTKEIGPKLRENARQNGKECREPGDELIYHVTSSHSSSGGKKKIGRRKEKPGDIGGLQGRGGQNSDSRKGEEDEGEPGEVPVPFVPESQMAR